MARYGEVNNSERASESPSPERKEESDEEEEEVDEDNMSMISLFECELSSGESDCDMESNGSERIAELNRKVMSTNKKFIGGIDTKRKSSSITHQVKMKRSKFNYECEPMDDINEDQYWKNYLKNDRNNRKDHSKPVDEVRGARGKRRKSAPSKADGKVAKAGRRRRRVPKVRKARNKKKGEEVKPEIVTNENENQNAEQEPSKEVNQENKNPDRNSNNFSQQEKETNITGESGNANKEVVATGEKNESKVREHAKINSEGSKENVKNPEKKETKRGEKLENLSKKVDQAKIQIMDAGKTVILAKSHQQKSRRPTASTKPSGKPQKYLSPFIRFYMTVHKELGDSCSVKEIAKEAGRRWRRMTAEEKSKFYTV